MSAFLIRVVDLETTGFEPPEHSACEIGYVDVVAQDRDLIGAPTNWAVLPKVWGEHINPGRPIPPETSAIHHIVDEDVREAATWAEAVDSLMSPVEPPIAVLAAHSAKFERLWLTDEITGGLPWICTYKCALRLWPDAPSHSNQAIRYWRRPEGLNRSLASVAHRAGPDAYVTAFHLRDMLALASVEQLIEWSGQPALQVRCHIGKQRGMLWTDVDYSFLRWVSERDFDEDVLFTVRSEMDRREREWEAEQQANTEATA